MQGRSNSPRVKPWNRETGCFSLGRMSQPATTTSLQASHALQPFQPVSAHPRPFWPFFFSEMAQFLNIRAGNVKGGLLCCRAMRIQFPIISHQSVLCICIPAAQRRRTAVTVVTIPSPEGSHRVKPKRLDPKKTTKQCNAKHIRQISNEQMSYKRNSSNFDNDDKCIYIYIL